MSSVPFVAAAAAALVFAAPFVARAQEQPVSLPRGDTTVSFGLGFSAGSSETGAALRVGVDRIVTGRLSLEVTGSYLDRGLRAESWTIAGGARLSLADKGAPVAPYVAAGAGVYRASFEQVGFGMTEQAGAACMGAARGEACYGSMPRFYAQRMRGQPTGRSWPDRRVFTDPMVALGGGLRWDVTPQLFLIPDARALLVLGDGDTDVVGVFTVSFGYRF
jgi:hypothetical protein